MYTKILYAIYDFTLKTFLIILYLYHLFMNEIINVKKLKCILFLVYIY